MDTPEEVYDIEAPVRKTVRPHGKDCHMLLKTTPQCDACDKYKECQRLAAEYYEVYHP